jgi:hypothetical protein
MKKFLLACSLAALLPALAPSPAAADATPGKFGIGFELGDPTGFNAKYWLTSRTAFDFVVGWNSFGLYDRDVYRDSRCYDGPYYDANRPYCDGRLRDDYGWDMFHFHMDYLIHRFDIIRASIPLPLYYGAGVQYEYRKYWEHDSWLGVRGAFGIDFMPRTIPFDFFFELGPVMFIIPGPDFQLNGGIGARYWF